MPDFNLYQIIMDKDLIDKLTYIAAVGRIPAYIYSREKPGVKNIVRCTAVAVYVNDVQVLSSLRIGGYAWVPESGNLNFKKIAG